MSGANVKLTVVGGSTAQLALVGTRIIDNNANTTVRFATRELDGEGRLQPQKPKGKGSPGRGSNSSTGQRDSSDYNAVATTSRTEPHQPTPSNDSGDGEEEEHLADDEQLIAMWCGGESAPSSHHLQLRGKLLKLRGDQLIAVCSKLAIDQPKFGGRGHAGENKTFVANRVVRERDAVAVETAIQELV